MKYIALIFSFYFTLLAVLPCQDRDEAVVYAQHTAFSKGHSCNERAGAESCPPFCTCSCCSTARSLTSNPVTLAFFFKVIDQQYPDGNIPAVQEQPIAIWQPPQIA